MITLVPMTESDFVEFSAYTIKSYADGKILAGEWLPEEGEQNATEQFRKLLPEGMATANHFFYTIVDPELSQSVGSIWYQIRGRETKQDAFILDLVIHERFQNRGYGTQTLQMLEARLRAMNVEKVSVRVSGQNTGSRRLNERLGYRITSIYMSKRLGEHEERH